MVLPYFTTFSKFLLKHYINEYFPPVSSSFHVNCKLFENLLHLESMCKPDGLFRELTPESSEAIYRCKVLHTF